MFHWLTERRRKHLLEAPFPDAWRDVLEHDVAAYRLLADGEQQRLRELVQVFIAEKTWEGCGGLELTDEMKVTIAGAGCLLLLGRDHDLFADVESILVYPSTVVAPQERRSFFDPGLRVMRGEQALLGEAHYRGPVILAWDSVLAGARKANDAHNVVIHELAHKIDFLDGSVDGTPPLDSAAERRAWGEIFGAAFVAHKARAERGEPSFLRDYAITNEAEYFAVATENFFEKPRQLQEALPDVYRELSRFYNLDLADRCEPRPSPRAASPDGRGEGQ